MHTRRAKAYSISYLQTVSLISSHFVAVHSWSVRCSRRSQKINKSPYFGSLRSFKVIDFDTNEKLVSSACYDRQHAYAYLQWRIYDLAKGGPWQARRARAYNGGLRAEPPAGSRSRVPGREVRGAKPPEAKTLFAFECSMEAANSPIFSEIWKRRKSQRHIRCNFTWRF